jgi:hypothetical protein
MKAQITITWNPSREEETQAKPSDGFYQLSAIERLDYLGDAIHDLGRLYETVMAEAYPTLTAEQIKDSWKS